MQGKIALYEDRIRIAIDKLAAEIQHIADTVAQNPYVAFRVKDPETLEKKMLLKKTEDVFSIDDIYGIRVIVESPEEAYSVLARISEAFPVYLDHDYIKEPKTNLRGEMLRLLQFIAYRNGVPFEIQITTAAFHEVNEPLHAEYHRKKYLSSNL